ncbi:MAG: phospholipase D-like domain-containing protein [Actinomycetota bacterium]
MANQPLLLPADGADVLWHPELADVGLALIETASHRLSIAQFIVAATLDSDRSARVGALLDAIVRADRRGVDVRVMLSPFRSDEDPFDLNDVAAAQLADEGVAVRTWSNPWRQSLHSKYLIQDETCALAMSANWSNGGLGGNVEVGAITWSIDTARLLETDFNDAWEFGEPVQGVG